MTQAEPVTIDASYTPTDQRTSLDKGWINDRAAPRWRLNSVACAILSGGQWHEVTVLDISLSGVKVRGYWDRTQPITAVSLTDAGSAVTDDLLILQATLVWSDPAHATVALCFDVPDREAAAHILKFLSAHIAVE